jgi:hypothetical protein
MQRRLVWIGVALAAAAIVSVARPQPAPDTGWLGVERWQLSFTLTRTRQESMDAPGMGNVTGTVHQRTESSSAAGTLVLEPWSDAELGHRSWEGRNDVQGQYRATATNETLLEEVGGFVQHIQAAGDERSGVSAALWIDVNAGTYALHVDGSWVPTEETTWTEFPRPRSRDARGLRLGAGDHVLHGLHGAAAGGTGDRAAQRLAAVRLGRGRAPTGAGPDAHRQDRGGRHRLLLGGLAR